MSTRVSLKAGICLIIVVLSCDSPNVDGYPKTVELEYTWENGDEGWEFGYADYPVGLTLNDSLSLYAMSYGHGNLPVEIQPAQKGMLLAGANRSDDLFMYMFAPVAGLMPRATYLLTFDLSIASNARTNAVGIGGAPGESVWIKAGAVSARPELTKLDGWYRMKLDKGNQSSEGDDMIILGHAGVSDDTNDYELITRSSQVPMEAKAGDDGRLWLMIGSDSGFEGYTALYYAGLKVSMVRK